ncbi:hypothetical protein TH53_01075 [Pedobacter lusitanus]|uniref:Cupin type-2 domain-containing protein n=1 Tax=Pedobacter lusitanus TaxID=1503925 RepID=A0A0D0FAR4_9SPHI|nr:cupin domain-containing protein [Pedobacter lusitanus]KIO78923.1 hypothetical protein TH53_01075 [Pedobacter lusitanus]
MYKDHVITGLSPAEVNVVAREQVRSISSAIVDGVTHHLGEQRDFRRNELLNEFIPESGRPSFGWVKLKDGERLDNHQHPTKSMILVCKGSVELTGDLAQSLKEGDIVCVPPHKIHGFKTKPSEVFEGLSIQFEGKGLYEDEVNPRADFLTSNAYDELHALNQKRLAQHQQRALFKLFESGRIQQDASIKERFIAALYVFSKCFQQMVLARQATCTNEELYELYRDHLHDEFGHDKILFEQNNIKLKITDPALIAASNWFVLRMFDSDEAAKIVIVHMVVEHSGHEFGESTKAIFNRPDKEVSFFELHAEADDDHANIGLDYLKSLDDDQLRNLKEICERAWDQMDLVHDRICEIALNN